MVEYGNPATHLKVLDVADLLDHAMVLFYLPMLIVQ